MGESFAIKLKSMWINTFCSLETHSTSLLMYNIQIHLCKNKLKFLKETEAIPQLTTYAFNVCSDLWQEHT